MKIQGINSSANQAGLNFKSVYVTTSTKNNGDYIENEVIRPFKRNFQKSIEKKEECRDFNEVKKNTNFYVLAAGKGKRFMELSETQGKKVNKISFAIPLENGRNFHMLDIAMAMSVPFADEKGLIRKNAAVARGSFAEVIDDAQKLREAGKPQKNVVVCCGDNMFHTDKPFELNYFVKDVIEDPTKQMGLVGVERNPGDVVNKFGVLNVIPTEKDDIMKLAGFVEKPKTLDIARKFETPQGKCIANTGMFVIKADAMEWLLDELEEDPMFIAKDKDEPYDFAAACTKVQAKYGANKCDVKLVETWEDAGEPEALYRSIEAYQDGKFLTNFAEKDRVLIQNSMVKVFDGKTLLASQAALKTFGYPDSDFPKYPGADINHRITNIDGVDIIV